MAVPAGDAQREVRPLNIGPKMTAVNLYVQRGTRRHFKCKKEQAKERRENIST
jgi:hypothetical protein